LHPAVYIADGPTLWSLKMKSARFAVPAAIALVAFAACGDPTSSDSLFDDSAVTADVAASAGDAVASMIGVMIANEAAAGGGAETAGTAGGETNVDFQGSRKCYDAAGAEITCLPFSAVRMIVTAGTLNATRSSTRSKNDGGTVTWTGSVNRTMNDTTRRNFSDATETSRVHTNIGVSHDTTTFSDGQLTRKLSETALDSVKALTFNLPRTSSPWPVSGSIVRRSAANVAITKGEQSLSRDISHRIEVVFPADAQGNVTLNIDSRSCQLNLVTHAVTNCQ
jgi:hypothetical protein